MKITAIRTHFDSEVARILREVDDPVVCVDPFGYVRQRERKQLAIVLVTID